MREKRITVLIPTRGRPENAQRLNEAIDTTADIEAVFCVDEDDEKLEEYLDSGLPLRIGRRRRLVGTLNAMAEEYVDYCDIIGFMGDDVLPHTYRWDVEIANQFQRNMVAYANDGWQGQGLPTAVFMDSDIVRKLGYMVAPTLIHLFADNYWKALGEGLGTLTYLEHVNMEHLHPFAGKAADDKTYQEANSGEMWDHDQLAFNMWVKYQLPTDVEYLRA
ncbi:glycosyltransferase [Streptomyces phage EGole]|uniref:Glycosyltransferase n=1 Tax=Streptomyces phage EGole TaxID=2517973 RepID=A0A482JDN1_9CAUD|nr:glycosyltransferase [Streptomyces phage EGole]QBP30834.1 glycosyltransferase [Streptomyces phage EGole]